MSSSEALSLSGGPRDLRMSSCLSIPHCAWQLEFPAGEVAFSVHSISCRRASEGSTSVLLCHGSLFMILQVNPKIQRCSSLCCFGLSFQKHRLAYSFVALGSKTVKNNVLRNVCWASRFEADDTFASPVFPTFPGERCICGSAAGCEHCQICDGLSGCTGGRQLPAAPWLSYFPSILQLFLRGTWFFSY